MLDFLNSGRYCFISWTSLRRIKSLHIDLCFVDLPNSLVILLFVYLYHGFHIWILYSYLDAIGKCCEKYNVELRKSVTNPKPARGYIDSRIFCVPCRAVKECFWCKCFQLNSSQSQSCLKNISGVLILNP